ncbi:DUF4124 domain-containing protein [Pseudoxanthomonas sacheonensis]|uniref:DUF4124 domain-containing protein n=1 Tax=Pseudoxanthomonas sacheonensis TaxID=443615 RepID=UPI0013D47443|nr:DUF4124 domain-containing protein [Pseudoxanthomonas sacheonensis]
MRIAILLLILLIAPPGNAQQVYKCAKGRDVSYQSAPCDRTQNLVKQWEAAPEPEPSADAPRHRQVERRQDGTDSSRRRRTRSWSRAGAASPISAAANRCEAAKARREARLAAVGLKRTFDLLRKLDDAVYEACKR